MAKGFLEGPDKTLPWDAHLKIPFKVLKHFRFELIKNFIHPGAISVNRKGEMLQISK